MLSCLADDMASIDSIALDAVPLRISRHDLAPFKKVQLTSPPFRDDIAVTIAAAAAALAKELQDELPTEVGSGGRKVVWWHIAFVFCPPTFGPIFL